MDSQNQNPFFLNILQDNEQGFESFDSSILMSTPHSNVNVHPKLKWDNLYPPLQKNQLLREANEESTSP